MTTFLLVAAIFIAIALACILPPLLGRQKGETTASAEASNLAILQDGLTELERDLRNGTLPAQQYLSARQDLERRVLEEGRATAATPHAQSAHTRRTGVALAIVIPLCAAGLYWQLGTPGAVTFNAASTSGGNAKSPQVEAMVGQLAQKLEKNPQDGNGWALLGRSYVIMQRYQESATAYARAVALIKDDADLLADFADSVAMTQNRRIDAKVMQIVDAALRIDPQQWKALAIAGSAAFDRQDYKNAVVFWQRLQARTEPTSELGRIVAENIAEAQQLGGIKASGKPTMSPVPEGIKPLAKAATPSAPDGTKSAAKPAASSAAASVRGTVSLSPALAGKVAPTDSLFIFARAAAGPRMPLAVVRRQVKDLPFTFTLDDSQAMAPEMNLSKFRDVIVGARISKSGSATPQSGDLQGLSATVQIGADNIKIVIDQVVP